MLGFLEWVEFNRKKQKKDKKNEPTTYQGNRESGNENHQGEADRSDQAIPSERVFVFREP